jgi:RHS repeat-associated protein
VEEGGISSTYANSMRYGAAWGYLTDPSGLQQLGARFYWPELGRFLRQDPIGDGMNWYAYAGNNPVVYVDPHGLKSYNDWGDFKDAVTAIASDGRLLMSSDSPLQEDVSSWGVWVWVPPKYGQQPAEIASGSKLLPGIQRQLRALGYMK